MFCQVITCFLFCNTFVSSVPKNIAWNGGPIHLKREQSTDFWSVIRQYEKDNVIVTKAVTYLDEVYVLSPRMKHGVLSTVWLIINGCDGVELQPFPELGDHEMYDCDGIQNAVDIFIDHLGTIWALDTGIVDTLEAPRCTCPPKVVAINVILRKVTKRVDISPLSEPTSLLQNIAVEYGAAGKIFIYISDATRGAILVFELLSGTQWTVLACTSAPGLQITMVKRGIAHNVLILNRLTYPGLIEIDTASLRGKNTNVPLRVYDEHAKPVILLGSDAHHVYLRHGECSDVLAWDTRHVYESSQLRNIHTSGPSLVPNSVASDSLKHILVILDNNYGDTVHGNQPTYHKITFIKL